MRIEEIPSETMAETLQRWSDEREAVRSYRRKGMAHGAAEEWRLKRLLADTSLVDTMTAT